MNHWKLFVFTTLILHGIIFVPFTDAEEGDLELQPLKIFGSFEFGALEGYVTEGVKSNDFEFLQRSSAYLLQQAIIGENWKAFMGVGVSTFTVIYNRKTVPGSSSRRSFAGITQLSTRYTLGGNDNENYYLAGELGIFPFKYNKDTKNLGEYMWRTMISPQIVNTGGLDIVGTAAAYLTGLHLDGYFAPGLHWDAFWTFEMNNPPLKAQSLTFMTDYKIMNGFLDIGLGLQMANVIYNSKEDIEPSNEPKTVVYTATHLTTQEERSFSKFELTSKNYCTNCAVDPHELNLNGTNDTIIEEYFDDINLVNVSTPLYVITDSTVLSFAGTKVMGRMSLNFQALIQSEMLGPNDLTFYIEGILLGTKKVPFWAETWQERTPIMFGINLPTFNLLDVIGFEMEYYPHKYPLSFEFVSDAPNAPVTKLFSQDNTWKPYDTDDWKFTLYARKTVTSALMVHAQLARDHFKSYAFDNKLEYGEFTERAGEGGMFDLGDFYWMFKFQYVF